ncbi:hypothetical protein NKG94_35305 [Micromonospora sp. M12]
MRNGRVLAAVLIAAVLILAVPLGLLLLLGKVGGDDSPAFNPAVGTCVKRSGEGGASAADCGESGAFTIVSKVDARTSAPTRRSRTWCCRVRAPTGCSASSRPQSSCTDGGVTDNRDSAVVVPARPAPHCRRSCSSGRHFALNAP